MHKGATAPGKELIPMKFSEMTYTRPDIDALLADCKALAAKAAAAPDGDALVAVYYAPLPITPPPLSWPISTTPATPATLLGRLNRISLTPTAPPWPMPR